MGASTIMASLVVSRLLTLAASDSAVLTTCNRMKACMITQPQIEMRKVIWLVDGRT